MSQAPPTLLWACEETAPEFLVEPGVRVSEWELSLFLHSHGAQTASQRPVYGPTNLSMLLEGTVDVSQVALG